MLHYKPKMYYFRGKIIRIIIRILYTMYMCVCVCVCECEREHARPLIFLH